MSQTPFPQLRLTASTDVLLGLPGGADVNSLCSEPGGWPAEDTIKVGVKVARGPAVCDCGVLAGVCGQLYAWGWLSHGHPGPVCHPDTQGAVLGAMQCCIRGIGSRNVTCTLPHSRSHLDALTFRQMRSAVGLLYPVHPKRLQTEHGHYGWSSPLSWGMWGPKD